MTKSNMLSEIHMYSEPECTLSISIQRAYILCVYSWMCTIREMRCLNEVFQLLRHWSLSPIVCPVLPGMPAAGIQLHRNPSFKTQLNWPCLWGIPRRPPFILTVCLAFGKGLLACTTMFSFPQMSHDHCS